MSKTKIARTVDLRELINTADATIRRDLGWLEQDGFLERAHGGAILNQHMTFESEYIQRTQKIDC
ncbi:MAG: DeoR family transcriptional regulator [Anaerolineales bacterium]|nr:DeoR family transcriptional regulator [Anaerolineales bacterium]